MLCVREGGGGGFITALIELLALHPLSHCSLRNQNQECYQTCISTANIEGIWALAMHVREKDWRCWQAT